MLKKIIKVAVTIIILLFAVGAVVMLGSVARDAKLRAIKERPPAPEAPPVNVTVQTISLEPEVCDVLELPAAVEANRVVKVSAEVDGTVEDIPFEQGATVRKGEPLILLNTDLLQAEYDRAVADADHAARQCERAAEMFKEDVVSAELMDQAFSAKEAAAAVLSAAKARLERATILCASDGVLNSVFVEEGEYIRSGDVVAEIVDVDTMKVVVQVPERDVPFFETGDEVEVELDVKGDKQTVSGPITYISELADEQTRATRLEITVKNNPRLLRSGQIVRARLTRRVLKDVIMVPLAAVIPLESGHAVYVVEDSLAQRRAVRIGLVQGLLVQIEEGLSPDERLIVVGHRLVGPGQRVNAVAEEDVETAAHGEVIDR